MNRQINDPDFREDAVMKLTVKFSLLFIIEEPISIFEAIPLEVRLRFYKVVMQAKAHSDALRVRF